MSRPIEPPLMTPRGRAGNEDGTTETGVDGIKREASPTSLTTVGARWSEWNASNSPRESREGRLSTSPIDGARGTFIVRRICAEEESSRRSRIYLQQLESWKNLRVKAWKERMSFLQPGERSASLQSYSVITVDDRDPSRSLSVATAFLLDSPPRLCTPSDRTLSPPSARSPPNSLLEKFYEGEVMRAAVRQARQEEHERRSREAAERRREWEERRRRDLEERRRELQEETRRRELAEGRLLELEDAYGAAKVALEGLRLREQQVEALTADVRRLTDAKEALQRECKLTEREQQRRIEELERALSTLSEKETRASSSLQEAQRELVEARRCSSGKERMLRDVNLSLHQMQREAKGKERELREATSATKKESQRADEMSLQYAKAQQTIEYFRTELQRCRDEAAQLLLDQAARFETLLAANESAAKTSVQQLQNDLAEYRKRCEDLHQERATERAVMETELDAQRHEIRLLHDERDELRRKSEMNTAELAERKEELQEEIGRNDEAERLLRKADAEISAMSARLVEIEKDRDKEIERRERLEALLLAHEKQLQRSNATVVNSHQEQEEKQNERGLSNDAYVLRPSFLWDEVEARVHSSSPSPAHPSSKDASAPLLGSHWLRSVELQTPNRGGLVETIRCTDEALDARLRSLVANVESALEAMLLARDYALRNLEEEESHYQQQKQHIVSFSSPLGNKSTDEKIRFIAAECAVKLMNAMTPLNDVLQTIALSSSQDCNSGSSTVLYGNYNKLAKHIKNQHYTLSLLLKEMQEENPLGQRSSCSFASILLHDPLIEPIVKAMVERLGVVLDKLQEGESPRRTDLSDYAAAPAPAAVNGDNIASFASPPPRSPRVFAPSDDTNATATKASAAAEVMSRNATRQMYMNERGNKSIQRHTFGFTGSRLQVSHNGTRLQRQLLPGVVDTMTFSALGALDHRTFLAAQHSVTPPLLFEYTIRVGIHCDELLIGFADRYVQLEGFGQAQNSLRYTNCYYLHLGRGTLYCPAQGMVNVPYRAFQRVAPVTIMRESSGNDNNNTTSTSTITTITASGSTVRSGEEITCSLDLMTETIRFRRDGIDCGVAFEHVNLKRALFPAFEVNSRGCTIEFV